MQYVAPLRNLVQARKEGDRLITLCDACYHVLKRTNRFLGRPENNESRERLLQFIEEDYDGNLKVLHYMELLRDEIGFDRIRNRVEKDLSGLMIGAYYGCMMLRPRQEMDIDDPEAPRILDEFLTALGCKVVEYPFKHECCGSFLVVNRNDLAQELSHRILSSARRAGAEALATTCPLCQYNLDAQQAQIKAKYHNFSPIPVFYTTQLLGLALGLKLEDLGLELLRVDPRPLLRAHNLL
jgi:heterodisulfide reductase subunit B